MKNISILGATGSIGASTLNVIRQNPDLFKVHSLVANSNVLKMLEICLEFKPEFVVFDDVFAAKSFTDEISKTQQKVTVLSGYHHINEVATHPDVDIVVAAIVGSQGLHSALAAVKASKTVLLANKEALVMGGTLFMDAVKTHNATLLPLDSEHNALFQCLPKDAAGRATSAGVSKLILTASGGPFRKHSLKQMQNVTLDEALKHPNWAMGAKVTLDSASLMNKGLELIEAHFLFDMRADKLEVLVHPQSIVHSLVQYEDGSFLAQLGEPDMCIPIAYALGYPKRIASSAKTLDLSKIATLTFEEPDLVKFPCLAYAFECLKVGKSSFTTLNAANEIAVEALLNKQILFKDVPILIDKTLTHFSSQDLNNIDELLEFDQQVRAYTHSLI